MCSRKSLRHLLLALLIVASALAASSCSTLIGADDYEDSGQAICNMMTFCYGSSDPNCVRRIHQRLELSPRAMRSKWLSQLSDAACLETCVDARKCLDSLPVCNVEGDCTRREDCCGFLGGTVDCSTTCCGARGALCGADSDCCPGAGGCVQPFGTCGGVVCRQLDAKCVNDVDCCSNNCSAGRCEPICSNTFCNKDSDCCSGSCESGACVPCTREGAICGQGKLPCCSNPPDLQCVDTPDGQTRCGTTPGCLPPGAECNDPTRCCSERCVSGVCSKPCALEGAECGDDKPPCCDGDCSDGVCSRTCKSTGDDCDTSLECCTGVCSADKLCGCSEVSCNSDDNCCTGKCIGGACKPACAPLDCEHSVCALGGPMDVTCGANGSCVEKICANDEYCCCGAWDALCAEAAIALIGSGDCAC
jgi:hypothetical protein